MSSKTYKEMPRPQLNQWHLTLSFSPTYYAYHIFFFQIGLFKLTSIPPVGEMVRKSNYKGFWFGKEIEVPIFGWAYNFKKK